MLDPVVIVFCLIWQTNINQKSTQTKSSQKEIGTKMQVGIGGWISIGSMLGRFFEEKNWRTIWCPNRSNTDQQKAMTNLMYFLIDHVFL